jgi:flagellar basal-body rod modification protein FlgD
MFNVISGTAIAVYLQAAMNVNKFDGTVTNCPEKWIMADSSAIQSAGSIQADYMKLLVTQLQNQNPLEPMDNNQMASQLAQLSQLGQTELLNTKFSEALLTSQRSYASSLVGKEVSYSYTDDAGDTQLASGKVAGVITQGENINLLVGDYTISLSDVLTVR